MAGVVDQGKAFEGNDVGGCSCDFTGTRQIRPLKTEGCGTQVRLALARPGHPPKIHSCGRPPGAAGNRESFAFAGGGLVTEAPPEADSAESCLLVPGGVARPPRAMNQHRELTLAHQVDAQTQSIL